MEIGNTDIKVNREKSRGKSKCLNVITEHNILYVIEYVIRKKLNEVLKQCTTNVYKFPYRNKQHV